MAGIDSDYFDQLAQTIIDGEEDECIRLINEGLEKGVDPIEAIEKGLAKGITQVGDDFGAGVCFLPELVMAADVMKAGVAILDEKIKEQGKKRKTLGKLVIGTVKGDIHEIGKSVVAAVLQANGYDVIDLGIDVPDERFVEAASEQDVDIVAMSSLLTLTIRNMGTVIDQLVKADMRNKVKVIVGGCPVTQEFADEIGADAVGFDAQDGLHKVAALLGIK